MRSRQIQTRTSPNSRIGRLRQTIFLWGQGESGHPVGIDRKSTRLNSSHSQISYAVFCLKKKMRVNGARKGTARIQLPKTRIGLPKNRHIFVQLQRGCRWRMSLTYRSQLASFIPMPFTDDLF